LNREIKLKISVVINALTKTVNILVNLALVPLLLSFLGVEKYGVWITIYSVVSWMNMFDLGLGNGLRLELTKAFSKNRNKEIKKLISTAYLIIGSISLALIIIFLSVNYFSDLGLLLGISGASSEDVSKSIVFLVVSFVVILTLKLIGVIYSSLQLVYIDNLVNVLSQIMFLCLLLFFVYFDAPSLLYGVALISTIPLILMYIFLSMNFFTKKAPSLKVSLSSYSKDIATRIIKPGFSFFIIQICCVILYSTDNFIIASIISPSAVTEYSISYKYFSFPFIIFSMYISTHWSSFIDALAKGDEAWIKQKLKTFNYLFLLLVLAYITIYFLFDLIVPIWIGDDVLEVNFVLNKLIVIYYLISSYTSIYIYVINASGKIKLQKYLYIVIALVNIPLSIILIRAFDLGSAGVILASSLCLLILLIFMPIQSMKILKKTSKGFWNH
jgi:O-antigen/teichoic acid export membrane protein